MNRLIYELESIYTQNKIEAKVDEENNYLNLKQRILTPGGFFTLDIYVIADMQNMQKYMFLCKGLGKNKCPSPDDLRKIELFNESHEGMELLFSEENDYVLSFEREFYGIDSYGIGTRTLNEAMNCVSEFQSFVKRNYLDLKRMIKGMA